MNVFFDVQGTLISSGLPRPHARAALQEITEMGHSVFLWSSGGANYAAEAARFLEVEDLVSGCYPKSAPPPVSVDLAVDDSPGFAERHGGLTIPAFDGDPEDDELLHVVRHIKEDGRG